LNAFTSVEVPLIGPLGVGTVEEISGFAINKPALKVVLPSNTDIAAGFHFKALISIGCAVEARPYRHIHGSNPALNVP
jgi:hypothetical protein